ncbi:hypothetical protein F2Q68_00011936 [Brassica cretica]|uniref:Oberon coiled-coil region domain-containing protein n=1 Tax=Brassica cretica TaxID=69181 RepID=A0A8S9KQA2_BRACR|nr:hypothetical protein F2Q68_00011936 [Brassica cretica]
MSYSQLPQMESKVNTTQRSPDDSVTSTVKKKTAGEYASSYVKQRLSEADAEKQYLFEKIKLQENSRVTSFI